ncbi:MAG TPA: heme ABC exporter ATP-binding protein CcmA [Caulobacteraceae bacterium]|jgi:heme exporter protein A|nr:heme ABC exporter ATP-binding protein CcmA [Caulobacteraceae bacterium]
MITGLVIESLAVERGGRRLFADFDLTLRAGEAVALTGANGAGKTSLLRAVAGLIRPLAGIVRFQGAAGAVEAEDARSAGLHLLGHHDGLKTTRTAWEELSFWSAWMGPAAGGLERAVEAFELAPLLDLEVRRLSAGQRRRLALARLAASPRSLWLLDEPLAPLDAARRARFGGLMAEHLSGGGLILAAVHDPLPIPARAAVIGEAA